MSEQIPRCPRCGKRKFAGVLVCACGYEFLPHRERIRCKHCGHRIPADAIKCPRCGADPRVSRSLVPRIRPRVLAVLAGFVLLLCAGWIIFRALSTNAFSRLFSAPESNQPPAEVIQVIYVVATVPPATATLAPTVTLVPKPSVNPTPTRRGVRSPTPTRPLPTPTLAMYPAPQLIGPAHTTVYSGGGANIVLEWQPVTPTGLAEHEWYRLWISYTGRDGKPAQQARWTKETRWTVPSDWWNDASPNARTFNWNVAAVRIEGINPFASSTFTPASPSSTTRSFIWN